MAFFLGIDLGTSYFKAGLFDKDGNLKGLGRQVVMKETGNGKTCELPVPVFWSTLRTCIAEALAKAGISSREILSVSYSSQANSFVLLDKNENTLTPLILWPDERAGDIDLPEWISRNKNTFLKKTGLGSIPGTQFAVAKLIWLQRKQPQTWERTNSILSISDYLTFQLTGQKISDVSTASLTGLLDVPECQWWDEILELSSLNRDFLPHPERTGTFVGRITKTGAELLGLVPGISYFTGALDHHCAAIGSGLPENNYISESTGTVLSCVSYTNKYEPAGNRFIAPGLTSGRYFQMAFNDNGAQSLEWYQQKYASEFSIPELLELAASVKSGCDGLKAEPCAYTFKDLEGFQNINQFHTHGHFVKAILESTSSSLADLIKSVKHPDANEGIISTGGGAKSRLWTRIKADTLKTTFFIPECNETACLGAAMIAAHGMREYGDWNELMKKWVRFKEIVKPDT